MASLSTRDVAASLGRKGFRKHEGHHVFYVYYGPGDVKTGVRTKMSHGKSEIGNKLIGDMARQCRLSKHDFTRLVQCTLSREQYEAMLVEGGHMRSAPSP